MNFIHIYAMIFNLYVMNRRKSKQNDPYQRNKQLANAYVWLRSNQFIKNQVELARVWGLSRVAVSEYLNMRRVLGLVNATKFDEQVLKPHNLALREFESDALVKQAKMARKPSSMDIASLLITQLLTLQGGQEIVLDKLSKMERELGELRELVTKLSAKVSS